ncbi:MAG: hypothetical protein AAGE59_04855 [Cyanobacteria bacterium P01_F01_bin.86]
MIKPSDDTQELATLVDSCIAARNITYHQYKKFSAIVLADGNVDDRERMQINRLFDAIQIGRVKIVD